MRTIAITNQKGGVGKTTTVANLGAAITARGLDTCLVDMDPQGHLTLHFDLYPDDKTPSIYDVLIGESTLSLVAERISNNLCVLPSYIDLAATESELASNEGWEYRLKNALQAASDLPHEYVLIDCPPSLGILTINSLVAADEVIIPLQPQFLAMQGLAALLDTILSIRQHLNPRLRVTGIVFCMYESITRLSNDIVREIREFFENARGSNLPWADARIFSSTIRRNIRLAESPSHGKTIFDYDSTCNGAMDYAALCEEFLQMFPPANNKETPQHNIQQASVPEPTLGNSNGSQQGPGLI